MNKSDIGQQFFNNTKLNSLSLSGQEQGLPEPKPFSTSPGQVFNLPDVSSIKLTAKSLRQCLDNRRSQRQYIDRYITSNDLSLLLHYSHGIQHLKKNVSLRPVPSAGARHPFDCYVYCHKVSGIAPNLYLYSPIHHQLISHKNNIKSPAKLSEACLQQKFVANAAAIFFWVAVAERSTWRYSERGYRYLWLEAGHIAQNLYLSCQLVNCGCCSIASFLDDHINYLLNLTNNSQCYYLATIGKV